MSNRLQLQLSDQCPSYLIVQMNTFLYFIPQPPLPLPLQPAETLNRPLQCLLTEIYNHSAFISSSALSTPKSKL